MKVTEEGRASAEPSGTATPPPGTKGQRPTTWLAAFAATLLLVAVSFVGWRVFERASSPEPARIAPSVQEGKIRDVSQAASTASAAAFERATPESQPIAPDLSSPETVQELTEEARRMADRLEQSFPDDPDALEVKARVHFYLGSCTAAVQCWERCVQREPGYAYAYHGLGLVAAKKADYEQAVALQRKALAVAPGFSEAALELADSLMKLGKPGEAIKVLEERLDADSRSLSVHVTLGHAYLQAREYEKAQEAYRAALEIHSESTCAQFGLVTALARLGRRDESLREMERFKELAAKDVEARTNVRSQFDDLQEMCVEFAVSFTLAGRVCLAHGDVAEAERLCRRAAVLDPKNTQCRMQMASLYQQTGRWKEGLRMCRQLVEIEPGNWGYHFNLGSMCGHLGQFEEAEKAFQGVLRLAPQRPEGHVALARLYIHTGRKLAEAVSAIEQAIELDPENPQYREMLELARKAQ